jgi:hypothetical protein
MVTAEVHGSTSAGGATKAEACKRPRCIFMEPAHIDKYCIESSFILATISSLSMQILMQPVRVKNSGVEISSE